MKLDWPTVDRWIMGEAWTGSHIRDHVRVLCEDIGPRWSSSEAEWRTIRYLQAQMEATRLDRTAVEEFSIDTWAWQRAQARVVENDYAIDLLPFNYCPTLRVQAPIVDAGFGTPHELEQVRAKLRGTVAVVALAYEPFTTPVPLAYRLRALADLGASVAVGVEVKSGRRMEYQNTGDWREPGLEKHPLPAVVTSREDGTLLRRFAGEGKSLRIEVESEFSRLPTANVACELAGTLWPEEHLLLGGHHDTVYGSPGGNDNASGVIAVLEAARVLARLRAELGVSPGRSIRFVTFSAEEQKLQGSFAYVARHYGPETPPRLVINLDELSAGSIKGIVLAFPHLRELVQAQLDTMNDGLKCHVMAQLDPSSDHFPFLRAGLDAAHLWRWRFVSRHVDADFHHERGDTADKVNVRELKEYAGQLARLLLRLSHVPPAAWPANPVTPTQVEERLKAERGTVIRVF